MQRNRVQFQKGLSLGTFLQRYGSEPQSKHGISSLELARQLGVSQNTAWQLKHKLMQAMRERDERGRVKGFRKAVLRGWAARHLHPGTRVQSDGLACFRGVAEAGCEHVATVTGGGPGSCEEPRLRWVNTMLGNVKRSIDGTYHAIDAKHVPRYLAAFSYRFNRRYQLADLVPRLVYASANTPPMPCRLLKLDESYV